MPGRVIEVRISGKTSVEKTRLQSIGGIDSGQYTTKRSRARRTTASFHAHNPATRSTHGPQIQGTDLLFGLEGHTGALGRILDCEAQIHKTITYLIRECEVLVLAGIGTAIQQNLDSLRRVGSRVPC